MPKKLLFSGMTHAEAIAARDAYFKTGKPVHCGLPMFRESDGPIYLCTAKHPCDATVDPNAGFYADRALDNAIEI